ncbi:MAG: hypothetical protein OEM52_12430 [bacterium]|nr:hypothetical protein [bacterium]
MKQDQQEQAILFAKVVVSLRNHEPELWRSHFRSALTSGVTSAELYEAILQSYLFFGYPSGIEGLRTLSEVVGTDFRHDSESWSDSTALWKLRGVETCQKVYRNHFETLVTRLREITPDLTESMIYEGYGKIIGRPGLSLPLREFLIAAMLATGSFSKQFEAHLYGCHHVGTPKEWMIEWFNSEFAQMSLSAQPIWQKFYRKVMT